MKMSRRFLQVSMKRLIECVPNFSEGRDASRIAALVREVDRVAGARVLDCHSDPDHNRSVVTFAGEPEAVEEAALAVVGKAAELIDLNQHRGEHPRIGATDVLPFVPLEGVSMEECVVVARRVGGEIWKRYGIPVYFYESAATRPERAKLENIRRGQFESLREEVLRDPDRAPDVGEAATASDSGSSCGGREEAADRLQHYAQHSGCFGCRADRTRHSRVERGPACGESDWRGRSISRTDAGVDESDGFRGDVDPASI